MWVKQEGGKTQDAAFYLLWFLPLLIQQMKRAELDNWVKYDMDMELTYSDETSKSISLSAIL